MLEALSHSVVTLSCSFATFSVSLVLYAKATQTIFPKAIGNTFYTILGLFVLTGIVLAASPLNGVMVPHTYATPKMVRIAMEPPELGHGNVFTPPPKAATYKTKNSTYTEYPICQMTFGNPSLDLKRRLTVLDLNVFAAAIYYAEKDHIMEVVLNATSGTDLAGDEELEELESEYTVGRWGIFKIPAAKTRVVAIRGTKTFDDALADADLWMSIKVLQVFSVFVPVLHLLPHSLTARLLQLVSLRRFLDEKRIWFDLVEATRRAKEKSENDGYTIVATGHSLGGGLAQIVGAQLEVPALAWSPVGVMYSHERFSIDLHDVARHVVIVDPNKDLVPRIDEQVGFTQHILCTGNALECHSVRRSGCEIYRVCGDARGRSMRPNCEMSVGEDWDWKEAKKPAGKAKSAEKAKKAKPAE
jgi:hypothetical protein